MTSLQANHVRCGLTAACDELPLLNLSSLKKSLMASTRPIYWFVQRQRPRWLESLKATKRFAAEDECHARPGPSTQAVVAAAAWVAMTKQKVNPPCLQAKCDAFTLKTELQNSGRAYDAGDVFG
jgi:hypothetical protein